MKKKDTKKITKSQALKDIKKLKKELFLYQKELIHLIFIITRLKM